MKYSSKLVTKNERTMPASEVAEFVQKNFAPDKMVVVDIRRRDKLHDEIMLECARMLYWEHVLSMRFGDGWIKLVFEADPDNDTMQREVLIEIDGDAATITEDKMVDITQLASPGSPF